MIPQIDWEAFIRSLGNSSTPRLAAIKNKADAIAGILLAYLQGETNPGGISNSGGEPGGFEPPGAPGVVLRAPLNLSAVGGENVVDLSWSPTPYAVRYEIERQAVTGGAIVLLPQVSSLTYVDSNVAEGSYRYRVRAVALSGLMGPWSEQVLADVIDGTPAAPTTPASFAGTAVSHSQINLSWNALAAGTESIRIERRRGTSPWEVVAVTTGTAYSDQGLLERTAYQYRAYGVAADGDLSAATSTITVTTPAFDTVAPPVPGSFTATGVPGGVRFTWVAVEDPLSPPVRYILSTSLTSGSGYTARDVGLATEQTVPAAAGTTVYAIVQAYDDSLNISAAASQVSATSLDVVTTPPDVPPDAPTQFGGVLQPSGTSVVLNWVPIDLKASQNQQVSMYVIERATSLSGPWTSVLTPTPSATTATNTGLAPSTVYYYRMRARTPSGHESVNTPVFTLEVPSSPPAGGTGGGTPSGGTIPTPGETGAGGSIPAVLPNGINTLPSAGSSVHVYAEATIAENAARFADPMANARNGTRDSFANTQVHYGVTTFPILDGKRPTNYVGAQMLMGVNRQFASTANPGGSVPYGSAWTRDTVVPIIVDSQFDAREVGMNCYRNWTMRRYNMPGTFVETSDWGFPEYTYNCGQSATGVPMWPFQLEHSFYDNTYGSVQVYGCTFRRQGGRGVYIANRPYTFQQYPPDSPAINKRVHALIDNCHFLDLDSDVGRGAFNISFFDYGHPDHQSVIVIRNSTLISAYPFWRRAGSNERRPLSDPPPLSEQGYQWYRANGGIVVQQFKYAGQDNDPPFASNVYSAASAAHDYPGFDMTAIDHIHARVVIQNCLIDFSHPEKPLMQLDGIEEVIFENCTFITRGPRPGVIRINDHRYDAEVPNAHKTKPVATIRVRNCVTVNTRGEVAVAGQVGYGGRREIQLNTVGIQRVYNSEGVLQSEAAFNPATDFYNPATDINAIDPWNGMNLRGYSPTYTFPGVTV